MLKWVAVRNINLSAYNERELEGLLKLTQSHNQEIVAQAIAQNINQYNGWHFYPMFKYCTQASKKIIIAAIIKNITSNIAKYDDFTLSLIQKHSTPEQYDIIATYTRPPVVPLPELKYTLTALKQRD